MATATVRRLVKEWLPDGEKLDVFIW
jgi:hypothetical protein